MLLLSNLSPVGAPRMGRLAYQAHGLSVKQSGWLAKLLLD